MDILSAKKENLVADQSDLTFGGWMYWLNAGLLTGQSQILRAERWFVNQ
jgi:hypothetical protein